MKNNEHVKLQIDHSYILNFYFLKFMRFTFAQNQSRIRINIRNKFVENANMLNVIVVAKQVLFRKFYRIEN